MDLHRGPAACRGQDAGTRDARSGGTRPANGAREALPHRRRARSRTHRPVDAPPGTRHPAPGTRHPAPGTRHPAPGTWRPEARAAHVGTPRATAPGAAPPWRLPRGVPGATSPGRSAGVGGRAAAHGPSARLTAPRRDQRNEPAEGPTDRARARWWPGTAARLPADARAVSAVAGPRPAAPARPLPARTQAAARAPVDGRRPPRSASTAPHRGGRTGSPSARPGPRQDLPAVRGPGRHPGTHEGPLPRCGRGPSARRTLSWTTRSAPRSTRTAGRRR